MDKICKLDDCPTPILPRDGSARGYCTRHYNRWKRHDGDPYGGHDRAKAYNGAPCSHEDCTDEAKKLGLCNKHYLQLPKQVQRKAKHYQDNREIYIARAVKWEKDNPESRAATHVKRKTACELSPEDLDISIEYRKAIANDPCFYCGDPGEQVDHYHALDKGGTDHWWNLVRSCQWCNFSKHTQHGDNFISAKVSVKMELHPIGRASAYDSGAIL